jgi:hypothetical protein
MIPFLPMLQDVQGRVIGNRLLRQSKTQTQWRGTAATIAGGSVHQRILRGVIRTLLHLSAGFSDVKYARNSTDLTAHDFLTPS